MALSQPPQPERDRGTHRRWVALFWIFLTLLAIVAVWYFFLGPGAHGPILPRLHL
jgi:hypothetical protein